MQRDIEDSEIEPLAIGAWILGTGGGGSPYLNYLNFASCMPTAAVCA
jgi:DUF917 family protein